jgi:hypothetical protein
MITMALTIVDAIKKEGRSVAYDLVGIFQGFLALIVNIATTEWKRQPIVENGVVVGVSRYKFDITRKPLDPIRSAVHGAVQYYLGAIGYNIHTGQPLISVLPRCQSAYVMALGVSPWMACEGRPSSTTGILRRNNRDQPGSKNSELRRTLLPLSAPDRGGAQAT